MSIKSGQRYKITNKLTRLVIDLSGGDNKSIIGFKFHGGENQLWITEEQDDGLWTIQSVSAQTYIGFENDLEDGTHLVALDKPQLWDIETLKCDHPNKINIKLRVCDTDYIADYPLEKPVSGTSIQLWEDVNGKNQIWVLEEYS